MKGFIKGVKSIMANNYFDENSKYDKINSFSSIRFGHDKPVLEVELNELQQIQGGFIKSLSRKLFNSGFLQNPSNNIIYNPVEVGNEYDVPIDNGQEGQIGNSSGEMRKINHIALAPTIAIIDGHEIVLSGNFRPKNENSNFIDINLGDAPSKGARDDLVYLEVWFKEVGGGGNDILTEWGYLKGKKINNQIRDRRINIDTTRRIIACWDIKIAHDVNFDILDNEKLWQYKNGKNICAQAHLSNDLGNTFKYLHASSNIFKDYSFYNDSNLWIASNIENNKVKDDINIGNIYGKFIYAMPMFRVKRRNKSKYSINNYNGSIEYSNNQANIDSSVVNGDINSVRPDKKYFNWVESSDIVDLRKMIYNGYDKLLDDGLNKLFRGKLNTNEFNRLKRIQFGTFNVNNLDYSYNSLIFHADFNNEIEPYVKNTSNPDYQLQPSNYDDLNFKASISNKGLLFNNKFNIRYDLNEAFNIGQGIIDFHIEPLWDYNDEHSQVIFQLCEETRNNVVMSLTREKNSLVLINNHNNGQNIINIDLKQVPITKNNIYHIRILWENDLLIYINGEQVGNTYYMPNTIDKVNTLRIGGLNNEDIYDGFVIEDFMIYDNILKVTRIDGEIISEFWPQLPEDVRKKQASLFPSFNGQYTGFRDGTHFQDNILSFENIINGTVTIRTPSEAIICDDEIIVYDYNGNIINGDWVGLNTNEAIFTPEDIDESTTKLIIQYKIKILENKISFEVPNELLSAGILSQHFDETTSEYSYSTDEISFAHENAIEPRVVEFVKPRRFENNNGEGYYEDIGKDYSINNRDVHMGGARFLDYYMKGNNSKKYFIKDNLYGYEVLGVLKCNYEITDIYKVVDYTDDENHEQSDGFIIEFKNTIYNESDNIIKFELALGGVAFDCNQHNKTLISNIHRTKWLTISATGEDREYTIPCFDNEYNGGVIKSVLGYIDNDGNVNNVYYTNYFRDRSNSLPTYHNDEFKLVDDGIIYSYEIKSGIGTPFLKIRFSDDKLWAAGTIIKIPVLVSYQPSCDDIISIWYDYAPYQGVLSTKPKKVKRISEWKHFITTLGSGGNTININPNEPFSLANITDRLPGGLVGSKNVNGESIIFKHHHIDPFLVRVNYNTQIIFTDDVLYGSYDNMLDNNMLLETNYTISKDSKNFQDSKIILNGDFILYFPESVLKIKKYSGMASLVVDDSGEIFLFVLGYIDKEKTNECKLIPTYGDLFKLTGSPMIRV